MSLRDAQITTTASLRDAQIAAPMSRQPRFLMPVTGVLQRVSLVGRKRRGSGSGSGEGGLPEVQAKCEEKVEVGGSTRASEQDQSLARSQPPEHITTHQPQQPFTFAAVLKYNFTHLTTIHIEENIPD